MAETPEFKYGLDRLLIDLRSTISLWFARSATHCIATAAFWLDDNWLFVMWMPTTFMLTDQLKYKKKRKSVSCREEELAADDLLWPRGGTPK